MLTDMFPLRTEQYIARKYAKPLSKPQTYTNLKLYNIMLENIITHNSRLFCPLKKCVLSEIYQ